MSRFLLLSTFAVLLFALIAVPARAADDEDEDEKKDRAARAEAILKGTHFLRRMLYDNDIKPIEDFDGLADDPSRTILIVLGDTAPLARVPGGLRRFVQRGGALVVASDRKIDNRRVLREFRNLTGVTINANSVVCTDRFNCYRQLPHCPIPRVVFGVSPLLFTLPGNPNQGLNVATNVPSYLRVRESMRGIRTLAYLPANCLEETAQGGTATTWPQETFAIGGDVGKGAVLVLADHSVFSNEMMAPYDTQNVEFTTNMVKWLRGDDRRRDRALLVDDGRIRTNFYVPMKTTRMSTNEMLRMLWNNRNELLATADEKIAQMEDENVHNRFFLDLLGKMGLTPGKLAVVLLILASIGMVVYGIYRLGIRDRFARDMTVPLLVHALGRNLPGTSVLRQRAEALIKSGNLFEPACVLARQWWADQGVTPPVLDTVAPLPTLQGKEGGPLDRSLRQRLERVWKLACGKPATKVTPRAFTELRQELERLGTSRQKGNWRMADTPNVPGEDRKASGRKAG